MTRFASASTPAKIAMTGVGLSILAFLFVTIWVLVAFAGLGMLTPNIDLLTGPRWLWYWREVEAVGRWNTIGMSSAGGLIALLGLGAATRVKKNLHGAARWANSSEIARENLRADRGIILGKQGGKYLVFGGPEHVILYAPTRAGKGVCSVIPNLQNWPDSVVVLDIKKENWTITAGFRAKHGQRVVMFDPLDPAGRTARYNPLGYIKRHDPIECVDELQKIATMLFPTPDKGDPFWAEAARSGFIGVGALIAETPDLPFTIGEIYRQLTQGDPKARLGQIMGMRDLEGPELSTGCKSALGDFLGASDNTFASIKQTITSRMGLWVNPRVDAATSASDFDLRTLRKIRTSIYLGTSADNMDRVAPLYNLFFQQLIDLNTRELPDTKVEPYQVLVLLDEFPRLGKASVIANGFSYVAGYGLRLFPVIQGPAQLRKAYDDNTAEEIMTNCGVEVMFRPKDLKAAQDLSERLGFFDFKAHSKSRPAMFGSGKRTVTASDQKRALMLPQELVQMSQDKVIVLRAGIPAVLGSKIYYYKDRDFKARILPPPEIRPAMKGAGAFAAPGDMAALQAQMSALAAQVADIHKHVVVRPMTVEEAAGETPLGMDMVSMALDDLDLEIPPPNASEQDFDSFIAKFVDGSFTPAHEQEA